MQALGDSCRVPYLFIAIFSLLVSCSSSPPSASPTGNGKPFVVALDSAPTTLDPLQATDAYSERITHLLFSALVQIDPSDKIIPDLAEQWEIEDDRRYTFYLKRNVRFHDNRLLTSADVRYTYESILDPEVASPFKKNYEIIEKIETPNLQTVRFILKEPYAPFLISLNRGIIPKPADHPNNVEEASTRPIGSGPFSFVSYQPDHAVELSAFPDYFDGAPRISRLLFKVIPDQATRLLELQKGNIDLLQNGFSPDLLQRLQSDPKLKIIQGPSTTYSYLGFNLSDPLLKQHKIRLAIAHAIDKKKIAKYIFRDRVTPASGLLSDRHWAYAQTKEIPYDQAEARRLLNEAQPNPKGERLHFVYKTSQNEMGRMVAEVIQSQLGEVGIGITIRSFEWGTFYSDIKSGNFQLFSLSWVGVNDPDFYYDLFHSQSVPPRGGNRVRYQNQQMDELLLAGRVSLQFDQRKNIYQKVQEILAEEIPYVSLWHAENVAVMKKSVEGYTLYENGDFLSLKDVSRSTQNPR